MGFPIISGVLMRGVLQDADVQITSLGNTPGHVNHWTRWGFHKFVESRFHVQQVRSPLPWTMVRAIPA